MVKAKDKATLQGTLFKIGHVNEGQCVIRIKDTSRHEYAPELIGKKVKITVEKA